MQFSYHLLTVVVGLALAAAIPKAEATPVTYSFSVTATSGPLDGTTAAGTFSYDTSSIVPGGSNNNTGLLTALNFTWDGITYNQTTANTGFLDFNGSGMLTDDVFGNDCFAGGCNVFGGSEEWLFDFVFGFTYSVQGNPEAGNGSVTQSLVPEPSALALLGAGLAGLALAGIGRRQRPV